MEEDVKLLKDLLNQKYSEKLLNALSKVKEEDEVNVLTMLERQAIERILNELERLQKEFEIVDHECSRLEQKEIILESENEHYKDLIYALETYYTITEEDLEKCVKEDR